MIRWLKDLSVSQTLLGLFLAVALLCALTGAVGIGGMMQISEHAERLHAELLALEVESANADAAAAHAAFSEARRTMWGIVLLATSIALGLGWIVSRAITNALGQMRRAADDLASGNLDIHVTFESKGDVGRLADSFRRMAAAQKEIAAAAAEIAAGNLDVTVEARSEHDVLARSFITLRDSVRSVTAEARSLAEAAVAGDLAKRGDVARFDGAYRDVVAGINGIIDGMAEGCEGGAGGKGAREPYRRPRRAPSWPR